MTTIEIIRNAIETTKTHSAWDRGVNAYALKLPEEYENNYGANACVPITSYLLL